MTTDPLDGQPVIVGAGLAGLLTALSLAPRPCVLLTRAPLGAEASSPWAQGGLAAAVGLDDTVELHLADTLGAGDGLCDRDVAAIITASGPAVIETLARYGVRFDHAPDGSLAVGLEAAHSRRRIVHAEGDATGAEIVRALVDAVRRTPSITVIEDTRLRSLDTGDDGAVVGIVAERAGAPFRIATRQVVLATGGVGGLFRDTTNPLGSTGSGLAIAARAGARLGDLEFVQFHPTALSLAETVGDVPMKLISEAVRGEGATLIDEAGARFMQNELAPRDVVSRAVWRHIGLGHQVFLDARTALGERFATRFPGITAACRANGIDPVTMPIPIRPAAHYHMGGLLVDADGRSSIDGLYACGEVACTGLHGANRLASNSLLEAAACALRVAAAIAAAPADTAAIAAAPSSATVDAPANAAATLAGSATIVLHDVRAIMTRGAGVLRDADGLAAAIEALAPLAQDDDAALIGLMICVSASRRQESRGGHFRSDFPLRADIAVRHSLTMAEALAAAADQHGRLRLAS